ncbi:ABC transporter permease [uncultured Imperialibacter sp.]|uniref:ABC transporter permease n=1 Tax=uncultured Imperialibacter sp. TaxID=1672639 RepID=UPI0030D8EBDC|tara:strand:- start:9295 stop:11730 length:2436 start_codon:yes stop_codon:yes gene_type:complete
MLRNYFIIALRHLSRNKVFSLINLIGLSIGLATFLVIFIFVSFHKGFDHYHADADRIVRLGMKVKLGGELITMPSVGAPAAAIFEEEIPEVEEATRIYGRPYFKFDITHGDKNFPGEQGMYADPDFFSFFSIPVIAGDPATILSAQKSVVLTQSMVQKYFGTNATPASVVGKMLEVKEKGTVQVTGVCADVPAQTHFDFDILLSMDMNPLSESHYWMADGFYTFVKLAKGGSVESLYDKFPTFTDKYIGPEVQEFLGVSFSEFLASGGSFEFNTMPLEDIHLWSHAENELGTNVNGTYINVFLGIGLLILLLAVINFINLSAASNIQRLKEVGVRKVMGARRSALVMQFMTEAVLITSVAFGLGFTLQQVATPLISQYFGVNMGQEGTSLVWYITVACSGSLLIGMAAGLYPALLLSTTKTMSALKGQTSTTSSKGRMRNVLMVLQFSITIGLLSSVLVILAQVHYLQTKPLGYEKDQILLIEDVDLLGEGRNSLRQELEKLPGVEAVSITGYVPSGPREFDRNAMQDLTLENPETHRVTHVGVDEHFLSVMNMKLLAGRNFSREYGDEASNVIINPSMSRSFGWDVASGEALGKTVTEVDHNENFTVIGIVDDFHIFNMNEAISPFFFRYSSNGFMAAVRFDSDKLSLLNDELPKLWSEFSQEPMDQSYLNEYFVRNFEEEKKISSLFEVFTVLAIVLSGMGLFAITAFVTHQRTKEIGIRKVLGAEGIRLFVMLSKGVVAMLLIAACLCIPTVYYGMEQWLQSYPYRISVPAWAFGLPVLGIVVFALLVSGWHILKVIRINPVESLRDE